jgi:hypothetical protein
MYSDEEITALADLYVSVNDAQGTEVATVLLSEATATDLLLRSQDPDSTAAEAVEIVDALRIELASRGTELTDIPLAATIRELVEKTESTSPDLVIKALGSEEGAGILAEAMGHENAAMIMAEALSTDLGSAVVAEAIELSDGEVIANALNHESGPELLAEALSSEDASGLLAEAIEVTDGALLCESFSQGEDAPAILAEALDHDGGLLLAEAMGSSAGLENVAEALEIVGMTADHFLTALSEQARVGNLVEAFMTANRDVVLAEATEVENALRGNLSDDSNE